MVVPSLGAGGPSAVVCVDTPRRRYPSGDRQVLIRYSRRSFGIDGACDRADHSGVTVRVLGPMSTGERTLSPRERSILSALIVQAGAGVRADELADAYWGEEVPATWAQQVKTSVARIRAALGADAVKTVPGGYALGLDPDTIDAVQFERQISTARSHALHGEPDRALDVYRRALALWRGSAYPDLVSWESGAAEAARLAEIRMAAEEEILDLRLALGEHRGVIPEAERLVRAAPLREERWAILALANYRAGRQAEALAALRSARARLDDELGIDVGHRLSELETAILRQEPSLDAPASRPAPRADCPYQGLEAFGIEDSDEFFGRDDEAERIVERLRPGRLLALAGASGSGKSSLAMAGVLRRVIDRGTAAQVMRPAQLDRLEGVNPSGVTLVDQFEELFLLDAEAVDRLAHALKAHIDQGGTVLVTVRSDFLDRCLSHPVLAALFSDRVVPVLPMSREQLQEVIERPAERAGLRLEAGLTELILRDATDHASALPLLSHALAETWVRREAGVLTVDGYTTAGGLAGAVANSAEQLYQSWDAGGQNACRALMLRLVERGADGSTVRRVVPARGLQGDPVRAGVITALVTARLLTIDQDAVAISHETLVDAWPRLADWIIEDAEDARMLGAVASATTAWVADGRSADDLLHGARLQAAIEWQAAVSPDLTDEEAEFLAASQNRAEAATREVEARAARDRRQNRRLRWAVAGAAVLLVAAIVGGSLAAVRSREAEIAAGEAERAAENARIEALASTSLSLLDHDREVAELLAAEAYRRWPDDARVRSALWGVTTTAGGLVDTHHDTESWWPSMSIIPGSDTALRVAGLPDDPTRRRVDVVDIETGEVVRPLDVDLPESPLEMPSIAEVSPDGSTAVISSPVASTWDDVDCCWNHLTFFDLDSGDLVATTGVIPTLMSHHLVFDSAARTLYATHPVTADVFAIDTATGEVSESSDAVYQPFPPPDMRDLGVAIDGNDLVVGAGDHIRVYDRSTLRLTRTIRLQGDVAGLDLVVDGKGGVITTGWNGTVRVDLATGEVLWRRFVDQTRNCDSLHLATAETFACGSYAGMALVDLASGETGDAIVSVQLPWFPLFDTIDDGTLLAPVMPSALWMRWRVDGGSAGAEVVAKGRELVAGPEQGGSLAVTQPRGGGPMQLWDLEQDAPFGAESDRIVPLGSGVVARYDEYDGSGVPRLENIATGSTIPLEIPGFPEQFEVSRGRWAKPAFAWWPGGDVVAFDPATGRTLGPGMTMPTDVVDFASVSATPDATRAIVTWFDDARTLSETAVFEIATGELLVRGLDGLDTSIAVDDQQLVGIANDYARRYDLSTLDAVSVLARATGGSQLISVSADGQTLLNVGFNNVLTLYDLTANIALTPPIDSDAPGQRLVGGFLTADGDTLLEALPDGIRVWDLRPAQQASHACALAGRELSEEEWATYFPGEERIETCAALRSVSPTADE
jgi:DNA-binding SARP family transcriptional activator